MNKSGNTFNYKTHSEKIKKSIKIPPKDKLIWLEEFNEFIYKALSDKQKKQRMMYREKRRQN